MYESGFGAETATDSGIILGAALPDSDKSFVDALNVEQGPFVYFDKASSDAMMFMKWLSIYDPATITYFDKVNSIKGKYSESAGVPGWINSNQLRFKQELYNIYHDAVARVSRMMVDQGVLITTAEADVTAFEAWWAQYDRAGYAAYKVTSGETSVPAPLPGVLFNFWKANQGKLPPTRSVLGFGWAGWEMLKKYWLWGLVGIAGGVVIAKVAKKNRESRESREYRSGAADTIQAPAIPRTLAQNPKAKFHDAWPTTLNLKSGKFELIPLISSKTYEELRAMNQQIARRFKVVSGGRTLGELHKSRGRRPWRAVSYQGVQKYGRNRAALLTWLKQSAPIEAAQMAAKAPEQAVAAQQAMKALAANAHPVYMCNRCG
jgi:hypothetical protein